MVRACQPWVLPYLARLLDVQLRSPLEAGRRAEIGRAIGWRQRKGTPLAIEDIADQVAGMEVELREGWRKLAVTPRAGFTLLPESVFGEADGRYPARFRLHRAEHPGLPAGTVDFRRASRAVLVPAGTPSSKTTTFSGVPASWRQAWPHGSPCFPGSFQDVAPRTADLRTPTLGRGHAHPRRVVLHAPPFPGFFAPQPASVQWSAIRDAVLNGGELPAGLPLALVANGSGRRLLTGLSESPVRIRGVVELDAPLTWQFDNLWFDNKLEVWQGRVEANGCALRELYVQYRG